MINNKPVNLALCYNNNKRKSNIYYHNSTTNLYYVNSINIRINSFIISLLISSYNYIEKATHTLNILEII